VEIYYLRRNFMKELVKNRKNKLVKSTTLFMALFVMAIMLISGTVPAALRNNPVNGNMNGKPLNPVTVQMTSSGSMAFISSASENTISEQLSGNQQTTRAEQIIKYHSGYNNNAVGFNGAMTWEGAVRFTQTELAPYAGWSLIGLNWYHYDSDPAKTGNVYVYDSGTAAIPGAQIGTGTYTNAGPGLIRVNFDAPVPIGAADMWISVQIVQDAAGYPFGIDAGPQVDAKGGFLQYGGTWYENQALGLDYNWVLEGIVDQIGPTPDHDLKMMSIDAPVDGTAGVITPQCTVKNIGNNTETGVPVEMTISTTTTTYALDEAFEGSFPPAGWTRTIIAGAYGWEQNTFWGRANSAGTGKCADADVDAAYSYPMDCILTSKTFSLVGFASATLTWNSYLYLFSSDWCKVDISADGFVTYTNIYTQLGPVYGYNQPKSFAIPSAYCGLGSVQIRFHYYAPYWDYYWQVDDVKVFGTATVTEYDHIATIASIAPGVSTQVSFTPSWTPDAWQDPAYEDSDVAYAVTAEVQLPTDMVPSNDLKTSTATLHFPFLNDVAVNAIISPAADGLATTFPVKVTIKNVGQNAVKNFFTYVNIGEVGIGGTPLNEGFSSGVPPAGWTDEHKSYIYYYGWTTSYSQNAGGSSPEAMLPYYYCLAGYRFYTPPIDTTGYDAAVFSIKSYINHYSGQGLYTLKADVRTGYGAWNEVWSFAPSTSGKFDISFALPLSTTTQIAFYVVGNPFYFNYWYLDDAKVELTYASVEYNEAIGTTNYLNPGQSIDLTYPSWTPAHLATDVSGVINYLVKAYTDLNAYSVPGPDSNPSNDAMALNIDLTYIHDVTIKKVNSPAMGRGDVIFSQPPYGPYDYWNAYTSDAGLGYVVMDDFTGLTDTIGDLHWFGLPLIWASGWSGGDPSGLKFEIKFYDTSGAVVADFPDQEPTYVDIGPYSWAPADAWSLDLPSGVALDAGSVSIQSTSSPSNTVFLWLDSPVGDLDATQNGGSLGDNTAFNLTSGGGGGHQAPPISVYVAKGNKAMEYVVNNVGTFDENDMTALAEIWEFITPNGTQTYNESIPGVSLLPLGDEKTMTFPQYNFNVEGRYGVYFNIPLAIDDKKANNAKIIGIGCDATPPVSTATITPAAPDGKNGWYVSDVTVKITAVDPKVADVSSGVAKIEYQVDGGAWTTYSAAFKVTTDKADHIVKYRATDKVGNVETEKTIPTFKVDKTKPVISMEYVAEKTGMGQYQIVVTVTASDAMSGMDKVEFYFNEMLQATVTGAGPTYVWNYTYAPLPNVVIKGIAYDKAGLNIFETIDNPVDLTNLNQQSQQQQSHNTQVKIL
jgi:hypothetical protein